MNNIIYILLFLVSGLNAQTYFCEGYKQDIEKMVIKIDSFRLSYESNYQCTKWDIIKQTNNWGIYVGKIDVVTLNLQGCTTNLPKITANKITSDGYYLIDSLQDENDVLIKRVLGVPMVDGSGNHLPINSIYDINNFPDMPVMGAPVYATHVYKHEGMLFVCVQSHNKTEHSPEVIPALFTMIQDIQGEICPEWGQPISTNPYMLGECVTFNGNEYESLINNNVWSPAAYPAGWKLK